MLRIMTAAATAALIAGAAAAQTPAAPSVVRGVVTAMDAGSLTVKGEKGVQKVALAVHVFPPGVKMGEGHYGWDKKPGSMMTNGTVGTVVAGKKGSRTLEVNYTYGKRTITVPPKVPIVQITGGTRAQVKPGIPVFMVVQKGANGQLTAGSVSIGENGKAPPM